MTTHWDNYWALTSSLNSFEAEEHQQNNYQGKDQRHWLDVFAAQANGATIVDIGTGNGALLQLALTAAKESAKSFTLHGVDAAKLSPATPDAGYTLHSQVKAEALPFEDASINLVTSQFAVEYSQLEKSIAEIARVLVSDGQFSAILHHTDSVICKVTKDTLAVYQRLLGSDIGALLQHANKLLSQPADEVAIFKICQQELLTIFAAVVPQLGSEDEMNLFNQIRQDYANQICQVNTVGARRVIASLLELTEQLRLHQLRLNEQLNASLDSERMAALKQLCQQHFSQVTVAPQEFNHSIAWSIKASK